MKSQRSRRNAVWGLQLILWMGVGVSHAAQQSSAVETQVSQRLEAAKKAEQSQDYPAASRQYEEILKVQPKLALVRQSLAITYHLQNHFPEAIAEFQRALHLDATLWGSDLFLGMDYYKTNQFALAIAPLEKSISLNAKMAEPEARFWLAVTDSALNKPEDAVHQLRLDLALRPGNLDVLYYLTQAYDQAADSTFQRLGNIEPRAAAVSLLQAERFQEENRTDLAGLQYRNAVRLRPDFKGWIPALDAEAADKRTVPDLTIAASDARANLELAALFAAIGQPDQATAILKNLASQKATNVQTTEIIAQANARLIAIEHEAKPAPRENAADVLKGIELMRQARFREAEEPLSRAAEKNSNPALRFFLLRCYIEAGDFGPAEDRLGQVLTAEPQNVDALHLLGRSYKEQAETTLRRMIEVDGDFYGVHELLGRQHEERTEYDLAIKEYEAALAKRPDLAGIRYAIGNVYRKMSQYGEAEKWLVEELARNPYHGLAQYRLGSIYTEQGKADAAIPHLLEALRSHPQLTGAQLDLGRAYTAKGRYEEAIAALKHVAAVEPDNDRVHYLLSVAYSKEGRRGEAQTELADYQRLTRDRLQRTQQDVRNVSNSLNQ